MKRNWPYYLVLLLVIAFLFRVSQEDANKNVDWGDNYAGSSKDPYGCYITKDYLDDMMTAGMKDVDLTIYQKLESGSYFGQNYIFINNIFIPSEQDVKELLKFAAEGNTVFISAKDFGMLADTLDFYVGDPIEYSIQKNNQTVGGVINSGSKSVEANLVNQNLHLAKNVKFDRTTYSVVFGSVDTVNTTVLGTDGNNLPNFIRMKFGKGKIYLHSFPDAFGNYYAAEKSTSKYLFRVLSYLPDRPTFFDEHYKTGRVENTDTRRYIFSEPALKLGYLIVIIAGLLGLFFGGKRRQRPVPVVAPPTNSTLEFVEQVGVLYYRQGNHTDIVRKKINYFLENVRTRFYTQTNVFDDRFLERMENLSGAPKDQIRHLFATIDYLRNSPGAGEKDLKNLEKLIWEFNQRSKR